MLYDGCGEQVVLRGVNHPTMYVDPEGKAMAEIARTGANVVRLFWFADHGTRIGQVEQAIDAALAHGLLPMLELHDSTCAWELELVLDYWTSREARALIERHQKHLLINVANEPSPPDGARFEQGYGDAIVRLREAGIHVPLIIDAARCGRDHQGLLDHGPALLAADPDHNLIFSAHLYDPMTASAVSDLFDRTRELELPFIVGELANREPPGCGASLDYASILLEAERTQVGWLAWSWGDEIPWQRWNADCAEFDMTSTFSFDTLQGWGKEVAVTHPASIQRTSVRPYALTHGDRCD
jgi:mannan endo-1,4-beta-mannosidase